MMLSVPGSLGWSIIVFLLYSQRSISSCLSRPRKGEKDSAASPTSVSDCMSLWRLVLLVAV
jgi:hypothetical protein